MKAVAIDLTGLVFGRLTVLSKGPPKIGKGTRPAQWLCRCECGVERLFVSGNLRAGTITSCGCYRREQSSKQLLDKTISVNDAVMRTYIRYTKEGAKQRGLEFTLTDAECAALAVKNCTYCGVAPYRNIRLYARKKTPQRGNLLVNGIDRIDNRAGYTLANSVSCCAICNQAKHTLTSQEWESYIKRLILFRTSINVETI